MCSVGIPISIKPNQFLRDKHKIYSRAAAESQTSSYVTLTEFTTRGPPGRRSGGLTMTKWLGLVEPRTVGLLQPVSFWCTVSFYRDMFVFRNSGVDKGLVDVNSLSYIYSWCYL
jgi:hypothetical protein